MDATFWNTLLPTEARIQIERVTIEPDSVLVELTSTSPSSPCPHCRRESTTVHARYHRGLEDRPCVGMQLRYRVTARKFRCLNHECRRSIFCERLPELTEPHARGTTELSESHRAIGLALGGESGSRLAAKLSQPTSADTILRRVKSSPTVPETRPRYVGVDDWAIRKGHTYGTILVDLERGRVIDLLPGRDGEALKQWLAENPQVKVVSRDRWSAYREAAEMSAPQAMQVADRFHLLRNVREAVEKMLLRHQSTIRAASEAEQETDEPAPAIPVEPAVESKTETPLPDTSHSQRRRVREERFRQVKELRAQGVPIREISRRLTMNVNVARRYLRSDQCPDWNRGQARPTALDPYAKRIGKWVAEGVRNSAELFRRLKTEGFAGGRDSVRRYLNRLIGGTGTPGRRVRTSRSPRKPPPSVRKLSFRVVNPEPQRRSARILQRLRNDHPQLHETLTITEELIAMIRQQSPTTLTDWFAKAEATGDPVLQNMVVNMRTDAAAIQNAMTERWSNGQVEGQVGRLKAIKRQMYGRAGMILLKARVRHKG